MYSVLNSFSLSYLFTDDNQYNYENKDKRPNLKQTDKES